MSTTKRLAPAPPRLAIAAERRGGIRAASVGFALARALRRTTPKSGIESSRLRPPFESAPACAWRAVARTTLWKASEETMPWAVDSRSGRTADEVGLLAEDRAGQLVGHVRRDAPIVEAAGDPVGERVAVEQTAADNQQSGARRDQHDPDHRQRPRDRRAGPTVPRSRRSAATVAVGAVVEPRPHSSKLGSAARRATVRIDSPGLPAPARRAGSTGRPARSRPRRGCGIMSTEARPLETGALPDERDELRRRVWQIEDRLFMMVEVPHPDAVHARRAPRSAGGAGGGTRSVRVRRRPERGEASRRPDARAASRQRVAQINPRLAHVGVVVGANAVIRAVAKLAAFAIGFRSFSFHMSVDEAVEACRRALR